MSDNYPTDPALADALRKAGCTNATVLNALTAPIHPAETAWVRELLGTAPRGSLLPKTLTNARSWRDQD